ncbi:MULTISPECIES: serine acetyltransferase [Klebsiella]|uniref:serine acetyltransferase n=1 Tax=Klebsiella TaxID=570 RepID=UPI000BF285B8|nr:MULTISPECIES: serine acetyltransferase [Klebsiella]PEX89440.1 serine acetyltransferase [Klebsiella sp. KG9]TYG09428.1 serine acetyltransferase [Klebsiella grimontii]
MIEWTNMFLREMRSQPILKSRVIIFLYRLSSLFFSPSRNPLKYAFFIFVMLYYIVVEFLWGVEIKPKTKIGWGIKIFHPTAIIINPGAVLGSGIVLRHGVTIGNKYNSKTGHETKCPVIKDNVEFGAYACVIGEISIGEDSVIGAMSYVDFNVEACSIISAHRGIVLRKRNA